MWQDIILNAFCAVCGLAAIGIAAWAVVSGQIADQGIDGLFLLVVCLLIAFAFSVIPLQAVRKGLLKQMLSRRAPKPAGAEEPQTTVAAGKSQEAS